VLSWDPLEFVSVLQLDVMSDTRVEVHLDLIRVHRAGKAPSICVKPKKPAFIHLYGSCPLVCPIVLPGQR